MGHDIEDFEVRDWRTRMRFLADIVFASAMTIMIFNLEIPALGEITNTSELGTFILKQLGGMGAFFISFIVVAVYWMKHLEHFGVTIKVDQTYMWFQILFLAFIMLVPFWNSYVTDFPDNEAIKVFFSLNMIFIGLFSYLSFNYASNPKHALIHDSVTKESIKEAKTQILTEPALATVAAILVFIEPVLWDLAFIAIPVFFMLKKKLVKVKYSRLFIRKGDNM
ncbi:MAG: TMEM175 family protein [Salibacteraceae bacterium]